MTDTVAPIVVQAGKPVEDVVILKVAGQQVSGWSQVRVTRGIESVPSRFEIGMTAVMPVGGLVIKSGQACEVLIGKSKVVTGWIDRVRESGSSGSHDLQVVGRGLCCDLVDCSAEWKGGQIVAANALALAAKLAAPYGIAVYAASGADLGPTIPQFNLNFGETAYEIIERVTRYAGLLAYEDEEGGLLLSRAGTRKAASGLVYGQNVQDYAVDSAMDQRFSDYVCSGLSVDTLGDFGTDGGLFFYRVKDPNVTRHRLTYLVAESVSDPYEFCRRRADWQMNRAAGRGTRVDVTTDSWRDAGGTLWTPNTLVPVDVPGLHLVDKTLLLSEVTYRYGDDGGTLADLTLMPKEAFLLEPIQLQPTLADIPAQAGAPQGGVQ